MPVVALLTLGGGALLRRLLPRRTVALLRESLPIVGRITRDLQIAVFARSAATMLAVGLPLVDVLRISAGPTPLGRVRDVLICTADLVERGSDALSSDGLAQLFEPAEREILRVAEQNGLEAEQWMHVADRRADLLEERIRRTGALLEPILVVLVGVLVGGAVLALYLPTFRALDLL
jgi:type II secretory pathway component PulF